MTKNTDHGEGVGEKGEDPHLGTAVGAGERGHFVDPGEQPRPPGAGRALLGSRERVIPGSALPRRDRGVRRRARGECRDAFAQAGVRREDRVVAMPVNPWRWDQAGERGEEVEG
jgi:hypothetical protein